MVARKRIRHGGEYSSESNSDCFEIPHKDLPVSPSPLTKMLEDDVSGMKTMLRRRKQPKTTPATLVSSSSNSKMVWTKTDELIILGSIVDYEKETKLSYKSNWDDFYGYVKDSIEANVSKKQLIDKIRSLNKRFLNNQRKGTGFINTEDDEIFKLSMIIWAKNESEPASSENIDQANVVASEEHERVEENMDQAKDVPDVVEHGRVDENMDEAKVDVPNVEHEGVDEMDQAKDVPSVEHVRVNENMDQEREVPYVEPEQVNENMDQEEGAVPCSENVPVSNITMETDKGKKEKHEEDSVDEYCALKDALEATTLFQNACKYQQKRLLQKLKDLAAQRRKELADEWKGLLAEEMKLFAKRMTLSAKLISAGYSC